MFKTAPGTCFSRTDKTEKAEKSLRNFPEFRSGPRILVGPLFLPLHAEFLLDPPSARRDIPGSESVFRAFFAIPL